jgi:Ca2+-binding RTX toxin-like protein
MATFNGTANVDVANATTGTLTGFTGGTLSELQDASGDTFNPGNGADVIVAGSGDDTLNGSAGTDSMTGGAGNDIFVYFSTSDLAGDRIDGGTQSGGFGDQIQLGFFATADFSSQTVLSIEFLNLFGNVAHSLVFNGNQVGGGNLSSTLGIQGNIGADIITFNNVSSTFDISGFTFGTWDQAQDRIVINATSLGGFITGSSVADEINGGSGTDNITGGLGADTLRGGADDDRFQYGSQAEITGDSIDGGVAGANGDSIQVNYAGVADFTGATIASTSTTSIEAIRTFTAGSHDFIFNASQIGANGLSSNLILQGVNSGVDRLIINSVGGAFDISGFSLNSWIDADDRVVINAINVGGNDIRGTSVRDEINGSTSFDLIHGTSGADTLRGGAGNDTFRYANALDIVSDSIDGGADNDTIQIMFSGTADFSTATIGSTATTSVESLTLSGSGNTDVIFNGPAVSTTGLSSSLNVTGVAGFTDRITFNAISGSFDISAFFFSTWTQGTDEIVLNGGGGAETIIGTGQDDIFIGSLGADNLSGGGGRDRFVYFGTDRAAGDTIDGGFTGVNDDTIEVKVGSLDFSSATISSIERLELSGGLGSIVAFDGAQFGTGLSSALGVQGDNGGADTIIFDDVGTAGSIFNLSGVVLSNWETRDRFVISITVTTGVDVTGTTGNDTINSSTGGDIFHGSLGDDSLNGGAGRDQFTYASNASIGADTIDGGSQTGPASDQLIIGFTGLADFSAASIASTGNTSIEFLDLSFAGNHNVLFNGAQFGGGGLSSSLQVQGNNSGTDSITFNDASSLNLNGMQFTVWNDAVDRITINGSTGGDSLTGSVQSDSIIGGAGSDTIAGGAGDDIIDGGGDADVLSYFSAATGLVMTLGAASGTITVAGLGTDTYTSIEGIGGSNTGNDTLTGNAQNNIFLGYGGNDTLGGFGGSDTLDGGDGSDYLYGGLDGDSLDGGTGIDVLIGEDGDDTMNGGTNDDYLYSGIGNNSMSGGSGTNVFISEGTADTMTSGDDSNFYYRYGTGTSSTTGGTGVDQFIGGLAVSNDTFNGGAGDDIGYTGAGNDLMIGGMGNDVFVSEAGNDTLDGGAGVNLLWLNGTGNGQARVNVADAGTQVIDFFEAGGVNDSVRIIGSNLTSFADFQNLVSNYNTVINGNLVVNTATTGILYLNLGANQTAIWFQGIAVQSLTAADFTFG